VRHHGRFKDGGKENGGGGLSGSLIIQISEVYPIFSSKNQGLSTKLPIPCFICLNLDISAINPRNVKVKTDKPPVWAIFVDKPLVFQVFRDKSPDFESRIQINPRKRCPKFSPPLFGTTLMTRGSFGASLPRARSFCRI